VNFHLL